MSQADATPEPATSPWPTSPLAGFLSYLVPGLGQIVQGRAGKGLLFMIALLGMFFFGQAMGQWRNVYVPQDAGQKPDVRQLAKGIMQRWHYAGQFFIGIAAWPALWQFFEMRMPEGPFWHDFQRGPRDRNEEDLVFNTFVVASDKTPDLGWVYTVVAGMLNILVIYDAFAGPAFPTVPGREPVSAPPQGVTP